MIVEGRAAEGRIRVGVGGWDYDPWRESFYPPKLSKAKQLEHMAGRLTAGEAVERFCSQGLAELGDKLGAVLWQFMATKRFEPDDFRAFLALLPRRIAGVPLRHAVEPRHESFRDPAFVAMARAAGVAIAFADSDEFPCIADLSGDFVYARLQRSREKIAKGYKASELKQWADVARRWARGESPEGFAYAAEPPSPRARETFVFFTSGAKARNPAAAEALIKLLP